MTHVRKSKIVLDPGFHAVDSDVCVVDSRFSVSGFWIPIFSWIPDSLGCILDPKTQDSRFQIPEGNISRFSYMRQN